jgi:NitT/TauT family transport system substrate-binding protein
VYFVNDKFLKKNPGLVKAFVGATLRGWKEYLEHPESAHVEIKRRNPEMNEEWMHYTWQTLKEQGFLAGDPAKGEKIGQLKTERWESIYKILRDLDVIKTDYDWHTAFTLQFQEP